MTAGRRSDQERHRDRKDKMMGSTNVDRWFVSADVAHLFDVVAAFRAKNLTADLAAESGSCFASFVPQADGIKLVHITTRSNQTISVQRGRGRRLDCGEAWFRD